GDSIRSIKVVAKANAKGIYLTVADIFQHPTITGLASCATSGEYRREGEKSEAFGLIGAADRKKIAADIEDAYPLSRIQAGMIFHTEYRKGSTLYHDIISYRGRGVFVEEAFRRVIAEVVSRHELLRTGIELSGYTEPLQLVYGQVKMPLGVEDIRDKNEEEQASEISKWMDEERKRGFQWGEAPLMRMMV